MRILYGLCGEGMGHVTRSKVAIEHLKRRGHDVLAAASGKAYPVLRRNHDNTMEIVGLSMRCSEGALDLKSTIEANARNLPDMMLRNVEAWRNAQMFDPDAVVSDFDSFSWLFAKSHDLPIVSIDNAQILPRCEHDTDVLTPHHGGFRALETFTAVKSPDCNHYIVTTFFYPKVRSDLVSSTTLVPPVLRSEVLDLLSSCPPSNEGHVLVYKTASLDNETMLSVLRHLPARFKVYGASTDAIAPKNCVLLPFDERRFVRDLMTSKAVVTNAGMSLTGEALAFGKPIYAVPVREQFEQVLNACYLEHLGYGMTSEKPDRDAMTRFLGKISSFEEKIRSVPQHDRNQRLYLTLDELFQGP